MKLGRCLCVALVTVGVGGCGITRSRSDPRPVRFIPVSASLVSPSVGWAWGPAWWPQAGVRTRGVLAQTTDGGRTWQDVPVPGSVYSESGPGISGVRFVDAKRGYLYGSELLQTDDGGAHWHGVPVPDRVTDVETSDGAVYAVAAGHVYRISHRLVPIGPHLPPVFSSLVVQGASLYALTAAPSLQQITLWASHDRGDSWSSLATPCRFTGDNSSGLAAWSASGLALACGGEPGTGFQAKRFYSSTDGGQHWRFAGQIPGARRLHGMSGGYIAALAAANARTWILGEARGGLVRTRDGGRHWEAVRWRGPVTGVEGWVHVSFIDRTHAVAVPSTLNGDVLALTSDAGRTWVQTSFKPLASPAPQRAHTNPTRGWGHYWTQVLPGSGIQFLSQRTGFALSPEPRNMLDDRLTAPAGVDMTWPSPAILVSRDAGRSWRRSLSSPTGFWGLDFVNQRHGWAVGVTGLYRTIDGGRDWGREPEPAHPLVRVAFAGPWRGVGLTTSGALMSSVDGGKTWQRASFDRRGTAVCWPPGGRTVVLAGQRGALWRSADGGRRFTMVAAILSRPNQYAGWWVDLSCAGHNLVALAQDFCQAACGGGVDTILRRSTDGGLTWRRIAHAAVSAANPHAPLPVQAVAAGHSGACLLGDYANSPSRLGVACSSGAGSPLQRAALPGLPRPVTNVRFVGASFTRSSGWLALDFFFKRDGDPSWLPADGVWQTRRAGNSWQVVHTDRR